MSTRDKGQYAEEVVAQELTSNGHVIIGRNIYGKGGELDIVSRKGRYIYVYEVKSHLVQERSMDYDPFFAVNPQKVERMRHVYYQKVFPQYPSIPVRFVAARVKIINSIPEIDFVEIL
ncbi:MAG TPA: YraN family protein [Candidatus Paceibacterota bacterium]